MINRFFYNFITKLLIVIIEHVNKQDMKYREEILLVELLLKKNVHAFVSIIIRYLY